MDLDLDQLRSVVVLAEHLHFGRAAALYVSQPVCFAKTLRIHKISNLTEKLPMNQILSESMVCANLLPSGNDFADEIAAKAR
jgi:hypothetical protein